MVELNIPGYIHSCSSCSERESSSVHFIVEETIAVANLLEGLGEQHDVHSLPSHTMFDTFPTLKLVISHGGGAIPYQIGRFKARPYRSGGDRFEDSIKRLYYDTCVYSKNALELLIKEVGADNVLFGTENPGAGASTDPNTGKEMDDLKPVIESIDWLPKEDQKKIFEDNARKVFPRLAN
jgi:4-oxalmesaconate hydratase